MGGAGWPARTPGWSGPPGGLAPLGAPLVIFPSAFWTLNLFYVTLNLFYVTLNLFYVTLNLFYVTVSILCHAKSFLCHGAEQKILATRHFLTTKALQNHTRDIKVIILHSRKKFGLLACMLAIYLTSEIKPSFYFTCVAVCKILAVEGFLAGRDYKILQIETQKGTLNFAVRHHKVK